MAIGWSHFLSYQTGFSIFYSRSYVELTLRKLRSAHTVSQILDWVSISKGSAKVGMPSMVLLFATGAHMGMAAWGVAAWILVTLGAIILMMVLTLALSRRRIAAIAQAAEGEQGNISATLHQFTHHPLLWLAIQTRVAIALGIVFLMAVKPDLFGSILTLGVALGVGIGFSIPLRRRSHMEPQQRLAN